MYIPVPVITARMGISSRAYYSSAIPAVLFRPVGAARREPPERHGNVQLVSGGISISFSDVAKRYDMRVIFRSVSGEAAPGEVLVITGPNGSGKSTLLSILCGLLRPTLGEIRYLLADGDSLPRETWRGHLGVVAPSMAVYEELTAMENLRFFSKVRGLGRGDAHHRKLLEQVGLDPDRKTPVRGFSTGMAQRLKIAQALLHEPEVLFLDEPGSNLDPAGQDWLEAHVRALAAAGRTVVLATNDRREMAWGGRHVSLAG
jgi:ABC-type multidrug transport system ATPase subunit